MSSRLTVDSDPENSIFAIVVGINEYPVLPTLQNSVSDAQKVATFLREELNATRVWELYDGDATKDNILQTIASLQSERAFKPFDAILFFFSGFAAKAPIEGTDSFVGVICPVETGVLTIKGLEPAIPDVMLLRLFDRISKPCGNNMTLFFDCNSDMFDWGDPDSCVIVTPEFAADTDRGGVFAESLINVLRAEKEAKRIRSLTVQSLARRIQVDNNDTRAIHCFGKSADRFLLDRIRGGTYHSFIFGRKDIGGSIILSAGAAQGIEPGTRLAYFVSDVKDEWNDKRGYLVVSSVSATSAVVVHSSPDAREEILPDIFYAAETQYSKETIQVRFEGEQPSAGPFQSKSFSWVNQEQDIPNITLKFEGDSVAFFWNGLEADNNRRGNYEISTFKTSESRTGMMLRKAARLTYHLSRPSPANALAKHIHIQLRKITSSGKRREPLGPDLLRDGCMSKTLTNHGILGPYCLVVENNTETDLWPYVFTFDPIYLNITPWYLPSPGANQPPLKAGKRLLVGCGDEEGLLFKKVIRSAIFYIRVFLTMEKTDFSFLQQHWRSPTEDRVRELESQPVNLEKPRQSDVPQGQIFTVFGSTWAAKMATVVLKVKEGS